MKPAQAGPVTGNLSHSMRDNYNSHGVEEYYKIVQESCKFAAPVTSGAAGRLTDVSGAQIGTLITRG